MKAVGRFEHDDHDEGEYQNAHRQGRCRIQMVEHALLRDWHPAVIILRQ
jgi:hypothetical protein